MTAIRVVLLLLLSMSSAACTAVGVECNQDEGNSLMETGDYKGGYENLRGCEYEESASGLTLGQLAVLYSSMGYGNFKSPEEKARRVYDLYVSSAKKNNKDALMSLVSIYETGEPLLSLKADKEMALCLRSISATDDVVSEHVSYCLRR